MASPVVDPLGILSVSPGSAAPTVTYVKPDGPTPDLPDVPPPPPPPPPPDPCGRCGWPAGTPYPGDPSEDDKQAFRRTVCLDARYVRTYAAFGGDVEVTFRSLMHEEEKACYEIAVAAMADAAKAGAGVAAQRGVEAGEEARFAASVESIKVGGVVRYAVPAGTDPNAEADVRAAVKKVADAVRSQLVVGVMKQAYHRYADGMMKLQARAFEPDFYPATTSTGPS